MRNQEVFLPHKALLPPFLTIVVLTCLRKDRRSPFKSDPRLRRNAAVAVFLQFTRGSKQQSVGNANFISKVYFPRLILPGGSVITSLVDFFISLGMLAMRFHFNLLTFYVTEVLLLNFAFHSFNV